MPYPTVNSRMPWKPWDRALGLDRSNTELQELRESIRAASLRAEKTPQRPQNRGGCSRGGQLEEAKQAAEEALEVAPDDAQAKTLNRVICRDIAERRDSGKWKATCLRRDKKFRPENLLPP